MVILNLYAYQGAEGGFYPELELAYILMVGILHSYVPGFREPIKRGFMRCCCIAVYGCVTIYRVYGIVSYEIELLAECGKVGNMPIVLFVPKPMGGIVHEQGMTAISILHADVILGAKSTRHGVFIFFRAECFRYRLRE